MKDNKGDGNDRLRRTFEEMAIRCNKKNIQGQTMNEIQEDYIDRQWMTFNEMTLIDNE